MNANYDASYAKYMDHTVLKAPTTKETITRFCDEAKQYGFASVCVNPFWVPYVVEQLKGTEVKCAAVIGFPLGATTTLVKVTETVEAVKNGAKEVDMVVNVGEIKDGEWDFVTKEISEVVNAAHPNAAVKVIIETCYLTDDEKVKVCEICAEVDADWVKTSSGFGTSGATVEDVRLMKQTVGDRCKVKASTGINDRAIADAMLEAGAERFGTSKGIKIVEGID